MPLDSLLGQALGGAQASGTQITQGAAVGSEIAKNLMNYDLQLKNQQMQYQLQQQKIQQQRQFKASEYFASSAKDGISNSEKNMHLDIAGKLSGAPQEYIDALKASPSLLDAQNRMAKLYSDVAYDPDAKAQFDAIQDQMYKNGQDPLQAIAMVDNLEKNLLAAKGRAATGALKFENSTSADRYKAITDITSKAMQTPEFRKNPSQPVINPATQQPFVDPITKDPITIPQANSIAGKVTSMKGYVPNDFENQVTNALREQASTLVGRYTELVTEKSNLTKDLSSFFKQSQLALTSDQKKEGARINSGIEGAGLEQVRKLQADFNMLSAGAATRAQAHEENLGWEKEAQTKRNSIASAMAQFDAKTAVIENFGNRLMSDYQAGKIPTSTDITQQGRKFAQLIESAPGGRLGESDVGRLVNANKWDQWATSLNSFKGDVKGYTLSSPEGQQLMKVVSGAVRDLHDAKRQYISQQLSGIDLGGPVTAKLGKATQVLQDTYDKVGVPMPEKWRESIYKTFKSNPTAAIEEAKARDYEVYSLKNMFKMGNKGGK